MALLLALLACASPPADSRGVYRSSAAGAGENAVIRGDGSPGDAPVLVWGPTGTVTRAPTAAPGGHRFLGQRGPLWRVDREVPAVPKAFPVDAALIERAGYKLKDALGTSASGAKDAARSAGVYVRSMVKVRRPKGPPVYVVTATRDTVGAGRMDGPADVREGENCKAVLALLDAKVETALAVVPLTDATGTCAVPVLVAPVDIDGDGNQDALVHGQLGDKGFRAWFQIQDRALVAGPHERWDGIP
jgi:hypothetical protein